MKTNHSIVVTVMFAVLQPGCSFEPETRVSDEGASGTVSTVATHGNTRDVDASESSGIPAVDAEPQHVEQSEQVAAEPATTEGRTSTIGRWTMELPVSGRWIPLCLVDIRETEDGLTLEVDSEGDGLRVLSYEVTPESVTFVLEAAIGKFDFVGRFVDGTIAGTSLLPGDKCETAVLIATDAPIPGQIHVDPQWNALTTATDLDTPAAVTLALSKIVDENPNGAIALAAFDALTEMAKVAEMSEADVFSIMDRFEATAARWGLRAVQTARLEVAHNLAAQKYLPSVAAEVLARFEAEYSDDSQQPLRSAADSVRAAVELAQTVLQSRSDDQSTSRPAAEVLRQTLTTDPLNGPARLALAEYEHVHGDQELAISHYASLAVTPMMDQRLMPALMTKDKVMELPIQKLQKLWQERYGSTNDLYAYLDQAYENVIASLAGEHRPPRSPDEGNRVAVLELFTSSRSPADVAAEMATAVMQAEYAPSEVIVLRYHQHVSGPDPMVCQESEDRFAHYYGAQKTPTVMMNGRYAGNIGGGPQHVSVVAQHLRDRIEPVLTENSSVQIDLSAKLVDEAIQYSATVSGPAELNQVIRLRLVIAEGQVPFLARNGIRLHEMVVRRMPGGVAGIPLVAGKAEFSETLPIDVIKEDLEVYLDFFERQKSVKFPEKPLALTNLHVIAMVQHDGRREILQARAVPVEAAD